MFVPRNLSGAIAAIFLVLGIVLAALLLTTPLLGFGGGFGGGGPGSGGGGENPGPGGGGFDDRDSDDSRNPRFERPRDSDSVLTLCNESLAPRAREDVRCLRNPEIQPEDLEDLRERPPGEEVTEPTIIFAREPIPGDIVPVLLLDSTGWMEGVNVSFNGRYVGTTNRYGVVWARVPYTRSLRVTARINSSDPRSPAEYQGVDQPERLVYRGDWDPGLVSHNDPVSSTVNLNNDITVNFTEPPIPGRQSEIRAHIEEVPVRRGAVWVNGDRVGRTDFAGRLRFQVPDEGTLVVEVRRGAAYGERSVDLSDLVDLHADEPLVPGSYAEVHAELLNDSFVGARILVDGEQVGETGLDGNASFRVPYQRNVSVRVTRDLLGGNETFDVITRIDVEVEGTAFPGRTLRVNASVRGEPVRNASVNVSGRRVGWTDGNGSLAFEMPLRGSVDVVVEKGEARGSASAGWPVLAYLLVGLGLVSLLYTVARRRQGLVSAARSNASSFMGFLVELTLEITVLLADRFTRLLETLPRLLESTLELLERMLYGAYGFLVWFAGLALLAVRSPLAFLKRLAAWLRGLGRRVVGAWRWLRSHGVRGLFWLIVDWLRPEGSEEEESPAAATRVGEEERLGVEDAWRRLAAWVDGDGLTAAEVRDRAVRRGFPSGPVEELTRVFRDVRYGERPETGERRRRAVDALERLGGGD